MNPVKLFSVPWLFGSDRGGGIGLHAHLGTQSGVENSFIGGCPKIPPSTSLPACRLCGTSQVFFFQIAFPKTHPWYRWSIAVFNCIDCVHEGHFIPEMYTDLKQAEVSAEFLCRYQKNFSVLVFKTSTGEQVLDYDQAVSFQVIRMKENVPGNFGQIGGSPKWILENETPRSILGSEDVQFLLQVHEEFQFESAAGARGRLDLNLNRKPERSDDGFYHLFIGNEIFFFGYPEPKENSVYVLTQVD